MKYNHFLASTEIKTEIKTEPGIVPRIKLPGRRCENCNKIMKRKGEGYYECPSCSRYLIFDYLIIHKFHWKIENVLIFIFFYLYVLTKFSRSSPNFLIQQKKARHLSKYSWKCLGWVLIFFPLLLGQVWTWLISIWIWKPKILIWLWTKTRILTRRLQASSSRLNPSIKTPMKIKLTLQWTVRILMVSLLWKLNQVPDLTTYHFINFTKILKKALISIFFHYHVLPKFYNTQK